MLKRHSFFLKENEALAIFLIGKAGKSIVKSLLQTLFKDKMLFPSNNSHIRTLDEIIELKNEAVRLNKAFLLDIDLEQLSEIDTIFEHIQAKITIVTNLGDAHLTQHEKRPKIVQACGNFLDRLPEESIVLLNKDDDYVAEMEDRLSKQDVIKFGFNTNSDFFASHIEQKGHHGLSFLLNDKYPISAKIFQFYHVYNLLIAICIGRLFNIKLADIATCLANEYEAINGRCNLIKIASFNILNDTFNHNFQTVTTAAQTLVSFKNYSNKMIMVIGDISGTRNNLKQRHINLGHFLAALPIDVILTFGDYAQFIHEGIKLVPNRDRVEIHAKNIDEVVMNLQLIVEENDSILLKANQASGLALFIDILRHLIEE